MIRIQTAALLAAALLPTAAWAADTAVSDQIDRYLRTSPPVELPQDVDGVISNIPERAVHGEVSVAVGTGGYRSVYLRSDLPVGKTGTLSIAVQESRNAGFGDYGYGYGGFGGFGQGYGDSRHRSLGIGLSLGGDSATPVRCRPDRPVRADEWADQRGCRRIARP